MLKTFKGIIASLSKNNDNEIEEPQMEELDPLEVYNREVIDPLVMEKGNSYQRVVNTFKINDNLFNSYNSQVYASSIDTTSISIDSMSAEFARSVRGLRGLEAVPMEEMNITLSDEAIENIRSILNQPREVSCSIVYRGDEDDE